MEKEICIFKEEVSKKIDREQTKVWLAKKHNKRVEYIFKIGEEQFSPVQEIAENGKYILFGQNTGSKLNNYLEKMFVDCFN